MASPPRKKCKKEPTRGVDGVRMMDIRSFLVSAPSPATGPAPSASSIFDNNPNANAPPATTNDENAKPEFVGPVRPVASDEPDVDSSPNGAQEDTPIEDQEADKSTQSVETNVPTDLSNFDDVDLARSRIGTKRKRQHHLFHIEIEEKEEIDVGHFCDHIPVSSNTLLSFMAMDETERALLDLVNRIVIAGPCDHLFNMLLDQPDETEIDDNAVPEPPRIDLLFRLPRPRQAYKDKFGIVVREYVDPLWVTRTVSAGGSVSELDQYRLFTEDNPPQWTLPVLYRNTWTIVSQEEKTLFCRFCVVYGHVKRKKVYVDEGGAVQPSHLIYRHRYLPWHKESLLKARELVGKVLKKYNLEHRLHRVKSLVHTNKKAHDNRAPPRARPDK